MGADYIPEKDHHAGRWMKFFARGLVEHPEAYRISPVDAAQIDAAVQAFRTANAIAWATSTATRPNRWAKNAARKAAERLVRPEAQRIRTDPRIPAELKANIGLKPPGKRRRCIPPPESVPRLYLSEPALGVARIQVLDSHSGRRARPRAAIGLELWQRIRPAAVANARYGPTPVASPEEQGDPEARVESSDYPWRFIGVFSRWPMTFQPRIENHADEVSYVARWVTRRGEPGRFGAAASIQLVRNPALRTGAGRSDPRRLAA